MIISVMKVIQLPQDINDSRLDWVASLLFLFKKEQGLRINLDWSKVESISATGEAILACLFDSSVESDIRLFSKKVKKKFQSIPVVKNILEQKKFKTLPSSSIHFSIATHGLLTGGDNAINMHALNELDFFLEKRINKSIHFYVKLIISELMQNSVDHSTSERYYVATSIHEKKLHVGVLDMGVTIPAKLSQKYQGNDDSAFLKLALKEGITTRRLRSGGLGLHHTLDILRKAKGQLTLISREAQIRRYFASNRVIHSKLKYPLPGTWCFAIFPIQRNTYEKN